MRDSESAVKNNKGNMQQPRKMIEKMKIWTEIEDLIDIALGEEKADAARYTKQILQSLKE